MKKTITIFIIFCLLLSSGCSKIRTLFKEEKPEQISNLSAGSIILDQEIRSQTIQLINNAKKAVFIELSSLDDQEIIDLLVNKSKAGLEVRLLLDQWQRENTNPVKYLKNNNVSVQYYPAQKGQYHRVRYMVIDYQIAVFYGEDWTAKGFGAHSLAIKLTGDTAWTIAKYFDKDWNYTTTLSLELPSEVDLPEDNITFALNASVKQQVLKYINSAVASIQIQSEQLSDPETVDALVAAKQRGCDIKLILSPSCAVATPNTIKKFKDTAIDLRYYNNPSKLAMGFNLGVFDNKTIVMTSSSWTYYSFVINHEGALIIPSPAAVERINSLFEQEWNAGIQP